MSTEIVAPIVQTETAPFKGRWGWYASDRETFLKVKEAHKLFYRAMRDQKCRQRWLARLPKNRSGAEPKAPDCVPERIQIDKWHSVRTYDAVLTYYRSLRYPKALQQDVTFLKPPTNFWEWAEQLRTYYGVNE